MSRERRRIRFAIAALTALLWGSLGISCEDIVSEPGDDSGPPATLRIGDQYVHPYLGGFVAVVDLVVTADQPFQAWNLKVTWDSGTVSWADAFSHPDFDDDGDLFGETQLEAKALSNIVDLRHGSGAPSGTVNVAKFLVVSDTADPVKIRALGKVAAPDGTPFRVVISEFATIAPDPAP
jgi:hypothetical protein